MSILWCGGEDIDFPNLNGATITMDTSSNRFTARARGCLRTNSTANWCWSNAFPGGAVTDCWFSFQFYNSNNGITGKCVGLVNTASGNGSGLWLGQGTSDGKISLYKFDGTTQTTLATSAAIVHPSGTVTLARFDVEVVSYGASTTVNVYVNSVLLLTYSGNPLVGAVTDLDAVAFSALSTSSAQFGLSEFIVSDEDTRSVSGLMTMALTGAGTTNQWANNTYSNINGQSISDSNPASDNTNGEQQQYNLTDLVAGTYSIKMVKISARLAKSASPAVTKVALGYNSGGSVAVGSSLSVTGAYTTYEQFDATSPVTSAAWAQSDMNGLQVNLKAVT